MKRSIVLAGLLIASPAMAQIPVEPAAGVQAPVEQDPAELLAQSRLQIGQLLMMLGNEELQVAKLKKELAAAQKKAAPPAAVH